MYQLICSREAFSNASASHKPEPPREQIWGRTSAEAFESVYALRGALDIERQEIRLLSLAPGRRDDPIQCTLRTVSLLNKPTFEALSYCWGHAVDGQESLAGRCYLNGHGIEVLPNLYDALCDVRRADESRVLWIDYLCIHQADTEERNSQVRLMGAIYAQAQQVLCYVGPEGSETVPALAHMRMVAADSGKHLHEHLTGEDAAEIARTGHALCQFMQRPWFYRIWTVQEVVLASDALLICGNQSIPWEQVRAAATYWGSHTQCCMLFLNLNHSFSEAFNVATAVTVRCLDYKPPHWTLYDLVGHFVGCAASDPRDHIYGILSLLSPDQQLVPVDYRLSPETVFRRTALDVMRQETQVGYLIKMFCGASYPLLKDRLPSWVADFAHLQPNYFFKRAVPLFCACGEHDTAAFHEVDESTVAYEGVIADTVAAIDVKMPASNITDGRIASQPAAKHLFDHLVNAERMVAQNEAALARYGSTSGEPQDVAEDLPAATREPEQDANDLVNEEPQSSAVHGALWRTLAFGALDPDFNSPRRLERSDLPTCQAARRALAVFAASPPDTSAMVFFQDLGGLGSEVFPYALTFTGVACSMRFFITHRGYIGMGPRSTQVGDTVAVFRGGPIPFVLRARPKTNETVANTFELLGGAYLEGGMDGELVATVKGDENVVNTAGVSSEPAWLTIRLN